MLLFFGFLAGGQVASSLRRLAPTRGSFQIWELDDYNQKAILWICHMLRVLGFLAGGRVASSLRRLAPTRGSFQILELGDYN